jgi:hypothetical protein
VPEQTHALFARKVQRKKANRVTEFRTAISCWRPNKGGNSHDLNDHASGRAIRAQAIKPALRWIWHILVIAMRGTIGARRLHEPFAPANVVTSWLRYDSRRFAFHCTLM